MIKYDEIDRFAKKIQIRDDLSGSFLSSIFVHNIDTYTTTMSYILMLGHIYKVDPEAQEQHSMIPNSEFLGRDMLRIAKQTNVILSTVFRRVPLRMSPPIVEKCIEILFNIGYTYTGEETPPLKSNEFMPTVPPISNDKDFDDLPSDISDFLSSLL